MKTILTTCVFATSLVVTGCATTGGTQSKTTTNSKESLSVASQKKAEDLASKLKVGMTKDEVKSALGEPGYVSGSSDGTAYWSYTYNQNSSTTTSESNSPGLSGLGNMLGGVVGGTGGKILSGLGGLSRSQTPSSSSFDSSNQRLDLWFTESGVLRRFDTSS